MAEIPLCKRRPVVDGYNSPFVKAFNNMKRKKLLIDFQDKDTFLELVKELTVLQYDHFEISFVKHWTDKEDSCWGNFKSIYAMDKKITGEIKKHTTEKLIGVTDENEPAHNILSRYREPKSIDGEIIEMIRDKDRCPWQIIHDGSNSEIRPMVYELADFISNYFYGKLCNQDTIPCEKCGKKQIPVYCEPYELDETVSFPDDNPRIPVRLSHADSVIYLSMILPNKDTSKDELHFLEIYLMPKDERKQNTPSETKDENDEEELELKLKLKYTDRLLSDALSDIHKQILGVMDEDDPMNVYFIFRISEGLEYRFTKTHLQHIIKEEKTLADKEKYKKSQETFMNRLKSLLTINPDEFEDPAGLLKCAKEKLGRAWDNICMQEENGDIIDMDQVFNILQNYRDEQIIPAHSTISQLVIESQAIELINGAWYENPRLGLDMAAFIRGDKDRIPYPMDLLLVEMAVIPHTEPWLVIPFMRERHTVGVCIVYAGNCDYEEVKSIVSANKDQVIEAFLLDEINAFLDRIYKMLDNPIDFSLDDFTDFSIEICDIAFAHIQNLVHYECESKKYEDVDSEYDKRLERLSDEDKRIRYGNEVTIKLRPKGKKETILSFSLVNNGKTLFLEGLELKSNEDDISQTTKQTLDFYERMLNYVIGMLSLQQMRGEHRALVKFVEGFGHHIGNTMFSIISSAQELRKLHEHRKLTLPEEVSSRIEEIRAMTVAGWYVTKSLEAAAKIENLPIDEDFYIRKIKDQIEEEVYDIVNVIRDMLKARYLLPEGVDARNRLYPLLILLEVTGNPMVESGSIGILFANIFELVHNAYKHMNCIGEPEKWFSLSRSDINKIPQLLQIFYYIKGAKVYNECICECQCNCTKSQAEETIRNMMSGMFCFRDPDYDAQEVEAIEEADYILTTSISEDKKVSISVRKTKTDSVVSVTNPVKVEGRVKLIFRRLRKENKIKIEVQNPTIMTTKEVEDKKNMDNWNLGLFSIHHSLSKAYGLEVAKSLPESIHLTDDGYFSIGFTIPTRLER